MYKISFPMNVLFTIAGQMESAMQSRAVHHEVNLTIRKNGGWLKKYWSVDVEGSYYDVKHFCEWVNATVRLNT